jgi:hypothetical protein
VKTSPQRLTWRSAKRRTAPSFLDDCEVNVVLRQECLIGALAAYDELHCPIANSDARSQRKCAEQQQLPERQ